jgi:alpha-tubulin suppressor-like RCC1 family protein
MKDKERRPALKAGARPQRPWLLGSFVVAVMIAGTIATGPLADADQAGSAQASLLAGHLATGLEATCVVLDSGSVSCWGENASGGLGNGSTTSSLTPVAVSLPAGRRATAVSAGDQDEYACAVLEDGSAACWGNDLYGQLGNGATTNSSIPVLVSLPAGDKVVAISASDNHACAVLDNSSVACWGRNANGELGNGTTTDSPTPVTVELSAPSRIADGVNARESDMSAPVIPSARDLQATAISAGLFSTCALSAIGSVTCWGGNASGELGNGTTIASSNPVAVSLPAGRKATAISAGGPHACAVLDDGSVTCWGDNNYGELGNGTNTNSSNPVAVALPAGRVATAISAGGQHTCAILDDGSVTCWGDNNYGELGNGTNTNSSTPVAVTLPAGEKVTAISSGENDSCALLDDGSVTCWGENGDGALGNGTTTDSSTPVVVAALQGPITGREAQLHLSMGTRSLSLSPKVPVTLAVSLANSGPDDDPGTVVAFNLPPGVGISDARAGQGSYDPLHSEWSVGTSLAGSTASLVLSLVATGTSKVAETFGAVVSQDNALDPSALPWSARGQRPGEQASTQILLPMPVKVVPVTPAPKKPAILGSAVILGFSAGSKALSVKLACATAPCSGTVALSALGHNLSHSAYRLKANQIGTVSLALGKVGMGLRGSLAHHNKRLAVTVSFSPTKSHLLGAQRRTVQI